MVMSSCVAFVRAVTVGGIGELEVLAQRLHDWREKVDALAGIPVAHVKQPKRAVGGCALDGGKAGRVHAVVDGLDALQAKRRLGCAGGVAAHRNDVRRAAQVSRFYPVDPRGVIKPLRWHFVGHKRRIVHARVERAHDRQLLRQETRMQPGVNVDDVGPFRRFGHRHAPGRILGAQWQPGDFGTEAAFVEPAAEALGEHVSATVRAHGQEPDRGFDHNLPSTVSRGRTLLTSYSTPSGLSQRRICAAPAV